MTPTNKVQTSQTFDEWLAFAGSKVPITTEERMAAEAAWNAALDSVILPEGKRTVELTVLEKLHEIRDHLMGEDHISTAYAWTVIAESLANGKTLDELCQQYHVATTREV